GGHFRQGIFLLTKMRVIVGYLLPLPPQNASRSCRSAALTPSDFHPWSPACSWFLFRVSFVLTKMRENAFFL
ncbi:hypothetical protein, partial [Cronobacter sakazakii]|uniref:hypothetical protein n=1 Tax=Cronobacter sakazakii TaxID=28141 RepID=UPI001F435F49